VPLDLRDAYRLLHEGSLALAQIEANGMVIDLGRLRTTIEKVGDRIKALTMRLQADEVYARWRLMFAEPNIGSRTQLGKVLFSPVEDGGMGYTVGSVTRTGRAQVDEATLATINLPFVRTYLEIEKLKRLKNTYLGGVLHHVSPDGFLRPSFNLHTVQTYRSSSDRPNFQNIPVRDPVIGKLIRRCFIARPGHQIVEIDYGALEFRIAACFWRDRGMVDYASDPAKDIHRDMAMRVYLLAKEQVTKDIRFHVKGNFVFATLYGSYYVNTSRNLWNVISDANLRIDAGHSEVPEGRSLYDHLADHGITTLGRCNPRETPEDDTFEAHIKEVEEWFHAEFPEWSERAKKWQEKYQTRGWFPMPTGFRASGIYTRNQIMNSPIQGSAFHVLLWSLIRLQRWLKKEKMRSVIVGQIHDSIVADVHPEELDTYLATARRISTEDVRAAWPWIVVPLDIEVEAAPVGGSWFDKKKLDMPRQDGT
jgi:DNA polymerase-1